MSDANEEREGSDSNRVESGSAEDKKLEIFAIIVLAAATILTAWSGFEATKWSGVQASSYTQAGAKRVLSNREAGFGYILALNTQANFTSWLDASLAGDQERIDLYDQRLNSVIPEAWSAWLELYEADDPETPQTPLIMPQYEFITAEDTATLDAEADDLFNTGQDANQTADNYVMATLFFAVALFFSGISMSLDFKRARIALLVIAASAVLFGGIWVATMPIEI